MTAVWNKGRYSRQAHADLPDGTYERELGRQGFYGPATQMYHRHPPTGWTDMQGPLRPRAFDLTAVELAVGPVDAPVLLHNAATRLSCFGVRDAMPQLARNADGDWLLFVHLGRGHLYCDYGHMELEAGDYVLVPRGTMWRLEADEPMWMLAIEATGTSFTLPDKGLVGRHAIFDPAMLDTPEIDDAFLAQQSEDPWQVAVKRGGEKTLIDYPFNPLDAVGWSGDLAVLRLNVRDIRPLTSHRYHLPPSAHTTFASERLVVCTFAPRPFETDAGALKVPFFHNNDDYDEVIFYHAGDFFSRDGIDSGMLTFHPAGFTHGPHPKALANMLTQSKPATDEYAVMIDTRDPLQVGAAAEVAEQTDYVRSWQTDRPTS